MAISYLVVLLSILPVMYLTLFSRLEMHQMYKTLIGQGLEALIIIIFISINGWWKKIGFRNKIDLSCFLLMWPLIVIIFAQIAGGIKTQGISRLFIFLLLSIIIGFCEETMFRGVIFNTIRSYGKNKAIIYSSILFSLAHLLNIFIGIDIRLMLLDLILTFAIGLVFAATYEKNRSLIPLIMIHALIDFSSFISRDYLMTERLQTYSSETLITGLILAFILIAWSLYVTFRKSKGDKLPPSLSPLEDYSK